MIYEQFVALCKEVGSPWGGKDNLDGSILLHVTKGRQKGKNLPLIEITHERKLVLALGEGTTVALHYKDCQRVDADGQPILDVVTDMTGRPVEIGTHIVYSVPEGRNSHALEIGKVTEITATGGLKVDVIIHNGTKVAPTTGSYRKTVGKSVGDPKRTMVIPIDPTTVMMWILSDFERMNDATA